MAYINGKEILFSAKIGSDGGFSALVDGSITGEVNLDGITQLRKYAFAYCANITSIVIPSSVTSIPDYAVYYCTGLTSIVIPSSVTSIGMYSFCGCSSLASIVIPSSVTNIGVQAFRNGTNKLASVTVKATTPPTLGANAFNSLYLTKIVVPTGCADAYKAATNWSAYADVIEEG